MPVVDNIVTSDNYMSLAHGNVLGFNCDGLAVDWTSYSVAQHHIPLVSYFFVLCNEDAVLITAGNLLQTLHVLDMLLVDGHVPENDAHVTSLGLSESKHQSVREVAPHVVRLDIGKQDISVYGQRNSQTISFPGHSIDHAGEGWDSE